MELLEHISIGRTLLSKGWFFLQMGPLGGWLYLYTTLLQQWGFLWYLCSDLVTWEMPGLAGKCNKAFCTGLGDKIARG